MVPYRSADFYASRVTDGSYQRMLYVLPWLDDDIWIRDVNVTAWRLSDGSTVASGLFMGQFSSGGTIDASGMLTGDSPMFNIAAFGGNGGLNIGEADEKRHFRSPSGYGFFFPGRSSPNQRNFSLYAIASADQSIEPFMTLRYNLASEVAGMVEPKVRTLSASASAEVDFLIRQEPWESTPINIRGVDLALCSSCPSSSMHVCNSANPDILMNVGANQRSLHYWLDADTSLIMPAAAPPPPPGTPAPPHVDCHIGLAAGDQHHTAYMLVYYLPVAP